MVSDKKVQASHANSQGSSGPISPRGKARTRLNALKSGLFTKDSVVAAAGETKEEFDGWCSMVWKQFQPQDVITAVLAREFAITYWRLQRPRRCETAEIRRQRDTAWCRLRFEKISEVDSLKHGFIYDLAALCSPALAPTDPPALVLSLEDTKKQLEQKSLGLAFLIDLLEGVRERVKEVGYLSPMDEKVLIHVCGVGDRVTRVCLSLDQIAKKETEKFKNDDSAEKTTFEQTGQMLSMRLKSKIDDMGMTKQVIEKMESSEEGAYLATLVMPSAECSEKIHRAEAALERRFFKILDRLLAIQGVALPG
jgi:hypothetical protein